MTKIITSLRDWKQIRHELPSNNTLGFVPTMGNLHPGHISLINHSKLNNDTTMVSIFVNPTQFNQTTDFDLYPRTIEDDIKILKEAQVDYCLLPSTEDLYPDNYLYRIEEHDFSLLLEGKHRPGHYTGVLTIVMKLFMISQAHNAYFGEKDYQQYQLLHNMTKAFFLPIQLHVCPTIRESSGLAYSSRNRRLSPAEKQKAELFAQIFHQPSISLDEIKNQLENSNIEVEYLSLQNERRYAAVHIGAVRLIDNYAVKTND